MPRRQNRRKVLTPEVQGDDSYVVVTLPHVQEIQTIMEQKDDNLESFKVGSQIIADHVMEWNWVDDDGEPLACPKGEPDAVGCLTTDEYRRLIEILLGSTERKKK
jgi:hypothetical protein